MVCRLLVIELVQCGSDRILKVRCLGRSVSLLKRKKSSGLIMIQISTLRSEKCLACFCIKKLNNNTNEDRKEMIDSNQTY